MSGSTKRQKTSKAKATPRQARRATSRRTPSGKSQAETFLPPKVKAFQYSTDNKTDRAYRDRLVTLKEKYGVAFSFAKNAKLIPQRKAAITRKLRKVVEFLNPENGFRFVPTTPAKLKAVRRKKYIAAEQLTTRGVFVPVPPPPGRKVKPTAPGRALGKATRKKTKPAARTTVRIERDGEITTKTGRFKSIFRKFKATDVARDPELIQRIGKKLGAEKVYISIKGHRGKNEYNLLAFTHYLKTGGILDDIDEAQETENEEHDTAFRNWFGVEYIVYDWSKVSTKTRKTKTRKKK